MKISIIVMTIQVLQWYFQIFKPAYLSKSDHFSGQNLNSETRIGTRLMTGLKLFICGLHSTSSFLV